MIAALYVATGGCYFGLPDVDPWDEKRDARLYTGTWPVVAHPPCERWGDQWHGCRPVGHPLRGRLGDDGGRFAAALASVRRWGGVLEHPATSKAWAHHGLARPSSAGWARDMAGGWSCAVEQGNYGHVAAKPTWLYAVGVELPSLKWGRSGKGPLEGSLWDRGGDRSKTPLPFRDLLLSIARTARAREAA